MNNKKILIADEAGFCRICAAILEQEGYRTITVADAHQFDRGLAGEDLGLVITSYPYGAGLLKKLKNRNIPTIILLDQMSRELMLTLDGLDKNLSHCLIKPLDYNKFRTLVNQTMYQDV
ncbi:MAG TPA: DNA-binding response regulator [Nitrospirota bacterium]|nr:DNA-binding response regulator [Nitrospirota bacterium]